jgi:hypothetical protein
VVAANHQARYQFAADPGLRYFALLRIALATGEAHVADRRGRMLTEPEWNDVFLNAACIVSWWTVCCIMPT